MLAEICQELNNWFDYGDRHYGTYTIKHGVIEPLSFLKDGQYYRIIGSTFNDGVYQYPADEAGLADETFTGAIWAMSVPPSVIALEEEIAAFNNSDAAKPSPYTSESWGGYSYSRAVDPSTGSSVSWQKAFSKKLDKWRKIG